MTLFSFLISRIYLTLQIGFIASIPLYLLYISSISFRDYLPENNNLMIFNIHFKSVICLALITIIFWFNYLYFNNQYSEIIIQLCLGIITLKLLYYIITGSFDEKFYLIKFYLILFIWCCLGATIYGIADIPKNSNFIPAIDNNDVFMYLLRGSSLLPSNQEFLSLSINNISTYELIKSTSKFAGSFWIHLFLRLTKDIGVAAAASIVAIRVILTHLLFTFFSIKNQKKTFKNNINIQLSFLFLLLAPIPLLLGYLFHLSQLMFIYIASLQLIIIWQTNLVNIKNFILLNSILVVYMILLYPVVLPFYAAETVFLTIAKIFFIPEARDKKLIINTCINLVIITLFLGLFWHYQFNNTDLNQHISASYYDVGYLSVIAHIILPLTEYIKLHRWQRVYFGIQQLIGLGIDILFFWCFVYWGRRIISNPKKNEYKFACSILAFNWILFQLAFVMTQGNYRAFKFNTTFMAIAMMFFLGYLLNILKTHNQRWNTLILSLIILINIIDITHMNFNRSVSKDFDLWIENIQESEQSHIIYDFGKYDVNMYLPLVIKDKKLYPLKNSYFKAVDIKRLCSVTKETEKTIYLRYDASDMSLSNSNKSNNSIVMTKTLDCKAVK